MTRMNIKHSPPRQMFETNVSLFCSTLINHLITHKINGRSKFLLTYTFNRLLIDMRNVRPKKDF